MQCSDLENISSPFHEIIEAVKVTRLKSVIEEVFSSSSSSSFGAAACNKTGTDLVIGSPLLVRSFEQFQVKSKLLTEHFQEVDAQTRATHDRRRVDVRRIEVATKTITRKRKSTILK